MDSKTKVLAAGAAGLAAGLVVERLRRKQKDVTGRHDARVIVVLGAQWGDEGKGKLVDVLAGRADVVARFNGGANAGHSLVVDGKTYAFHLLPCGMLRADCENVVGNGVVVHLPTLFEELRQLDDGTDASLERLVVSSRAHVLLDAHRVIDGMIEDEKRGRSTGSLGTTKRGVGPAYASKMNRNGLRFCDLVGPDDVLVERLGALRAFQHAHYRGCVPPTLEADDEELGKLRQFRDRLVAKNVVRDTVTLLRDRIAANRTILAEGANAALLDADFGTYPYVTSSSTTLRVPRGARRPRLGRAPRPRRRRGSRAGLRDVLGRADGLRPRHGVRPRGAAARHGGPRGRRPAGSRGRGGARRGAARAAARRRGGLGGPDGPLRRAARGRDAAAARRARLRGVDAGARGRPGPDRGGAGVGRRRRRAALRRAAQARRAPARVLRRRGAPRPARPDRPRRARRGLVRRLSFVVTTPAI